jgi:branched-subunit amino acid transport protein AzlD
MMMILAKNDPEILEIEYIKAIIDFKWDTYAFKFFLIQLILMIIVVVSFIIDVAAIANNPLQVQSEDLSQIVARIICMTILSILNIYEFINIAINTNDYSKDFWNYNDQLLFFLYLSYFVLSFVEPTQMYVIKAL